MRHKKFQLLTAPGLPSWPRLLVNTESRVACVIARHATWRSYQIAMRVVSFLLFFCCLSIAIAVWKMSVGLDAVSRIAFTLVACAILFPIAKFVAIHGLVGFLARQIFSTKIEVWISAKALVFRSRMYVRPVAIRRNWKAQSVRINFILNRDNDAAKAAIELKPTQRALQAWLNEAMVLEAVVSATNDANRSMPNEQILRRTIPLAEVNSRIARRFTTVLSAAMAITSETETVPDQKGGEDVDG